MSPIPSTLLLSDGEQARVAAQGANLIVQQAAKSIDEVKCLSLNLTAARCSHVNMLTGNQLKQLLRLWLSPANPSTNHNIARKLQHKGTAVWFFQGSIFIEWKSTASLLWVYGKRASLSPLFGPRGFSQTDFGSGIREKCHLVCCSLSASC